jgi:hypothetical protein
LSCQCPLEFVLPGQVRLAIEAQPDAAHEKAHGEHVGLEAGRERNRSRGAYLNLCNLCNLGIVLADGLQGRGMPDIDLQSPASRPAAHRDA